MHCCSSSDTDVAAVAGFYLFSHLTIDESSTQVRCAFSTLTVTNLWLLVMCLSVCLIFSSTTELPVDCQFVTRCFLNHDVHVLLCSISRIS